MEFCKSLHISKLETNSTMLRSCGKIYEEITFKILCEVITKIPIMCFLQFFDSIFTAPVKTTPGHLKMINIF